MRVSRARRAGNARRLLPQVLPRDLRAPQQPRRLLNLEQRGPKIHTVADHEKPALGIVAWVLLACPLCGVGITLAAGVAGWLPANAGLMALLFGVPAALTLLTATLARLSLDATFVLASGAVVITGAWLFAVLAFSGTVG
jgi:hypothetical protein